MNNKLIIEKVMNLLLDGDLDVLKKLKKQYDNSTIVDIQETGKGVFVDFKILDSSLKISSKNVKKDFCFGDVYGLISKKYGDVEFILFVRNGYIAMLEGFTYFEGGWNRISNKVMFRYFSKNRNFSELERQWLI